MINQQINLYQPIFRKARKLLSFRVLLQSVSVVFVLLVTVFIWSWQQTSQMETDLLYIENQLNDQNGKLAKLSKRLTLMKVGSGPLKELTRLEQELVARQKVVDALTRVRETYTRGVSGYMESFSRQAPKGVWLTGFSVKAGGEGVVIRGSSLKAALVPVFLQQLSAEPTLAGTQFGLLQIQRPHAESRYVDFTVYTGDEPPAEMAQ